MIVVRCSRSIRWLVARFDCSTVRSLACSLVRSFVRSFVQSVDGSFVPLSFVSLVRTKTNDEANEGRKGDRYDSGNRKMKNVNVKILSESILSNEEKILKSLVYAPRWRKTGGTPVVPRNTSSTSASSVRGTQLGLPRVTSDTLGMSGCLRFCATSDHVPNH